MIVRKLLKLGVRKGFLKETPEMPKVKIAIQPRSMLSVLEYRKVCQAAHRLSHTRALAPPIKSTEGKRERFWVAPRNMFLPPDMGWAIRFMVNSFIRPGDLRELKHKHVNVVRGSSIYLRLKLPKTKKHDKQMVTLQPAVKVYEAARSHHTAEGYGGDEDYVFLPAEKDRNYALAVLGFWFKWCIGADQDLVLFKTHIFDVQAALRSGHRHVDLGPQCPHFSADDRKILRLLARW